jgi:GT2 family glycosyltransferase
MRNACLFEVVDSIKKYSRRIDYRIYVLDDGDSDAERDALYADLEKQGHCVLRFPFDIGASAARNAGLQYVSEPYLLRMDDDFVFTPETRLDRMLAVLEADSTIGGLSGLEIQRHEGRGVTPGETSTGQGYTEQIGRTLWKIPAALSTIQWQRSAGVRFAPCDFCRNFLLLRRELLDEVRWDDRLKIRGEHIDFMLQIVRNTEWQLAFTPDSFHELAGPSAPEQPSDYQGFRYRDGGYRSILREKWGFDRLRTDRVGGSSRLRRSWLTLKAAIRE